MKTKEISAPHLSDGLVQAVLTSRRLLVDVPQQETRQRFCGIGAGHEHIFSWADGIPRDRISQVVLQGDSGGHVDRTSRSHSCGKIIFARESKFGFCSNTEPWRVKHVKPYIMYSY